MGNCRFRVHEYPPMRPTLKPACLLLPPLVLLLSACGQKGPLYLENWEAKAEKLEQQLDLEKQRNQVLRDEIRRYRLMLDDQLQPPAQTLEGDTPAKPAPIRE